MILEGKEDNMTERWKCSAGAEGPPESGRIYCGSVSSLFWCLWNLNFSGLFRTDLGRVPDDEVEDEVQAIRLTRQVVENVLRGSEEVHKVLEHKGWHNRTLSPVGIPFTKPSMPTTISMSSIPQMPLPIIASHGREKSFLLGRT
jgi:hypothetical protein